MSEKDKKAENKVVKDEKRRGIPFSRRAVFAGLGLAMLSGPLMTMAPQPAFAGTHGWSWDVSEIGKGYWQNNFDLVMSDVPFDMSFKINRASRNADNSWNVNIEFYKKISKPWAGPKARDRRLGRPALLRVLRRGPDAAGLRHGLREAPRGALAHLPRRGLVRPRRGRVRGLGGPHREVLSLPARAEVRALLRSEGPDEAGRHEGRALGRERQRRRGHEHVGPSEQLGGRYYNCTDRLPHRRVNLTFTWTRLERHRREREYRG